MIADRLDFQEQKNLKAVKLHTFAINKFQKVDSNQTCLVVSRVSPALKKDDNNYPQVFLKECKYKKKEVAMHIHDDLSHFSYCSGKSDNE